MLSFIVQLPLASSSRMVTVRDALRGSSESIFALMFDDRPGKLFEGLQNCRSVIFVSRQRSGAHPCELEVTRYQRWATGIRDQLFQTTRFTRVDGPQFNADQFPKYPEPAAQSCFQKILGAGGETVEAVLSPSAIRTTPRTALWGRPRMGATFTCAGRPTRRRSVPC
ncbi:MAG: hypothetical protein B7Z74_11035 [Deltaproteobacteria bacterium 21-66-5]|nr:MAG: hypothetical protein B7Z74_11035 [Deltaproteobacteria bacterium 21-66-5]